MNESIFRFDAHQGYSTEALGEGTPIAWDDIPNIFDSSDTTFGNTFQTYQPGMSESVLIATGTNVSMDSRIAIQSVSMRVKGAGQGAGGVVSSMAFDEDDYMLGFASVDTNYDSWSSWEQLSFPEGKVLTAAYLKNLRVNLTIFGGGGQAARIHKIELKVVHYPTSRYLVATGPWNSTSTWSHVSGGPAGAPVPNSSDVVYLDKNYTVTLTADAAVGSVSHTNGTLALDSYKLTVGMPTVPGSYVPDFISSGSTARTINLGSGHLELLGHEPSMKYFPTWFSLSGSNLTFNAGTSLITINQNGSTVGSALSSSAFNTLGKVFNDVRINLKDSGTDVVFNITGSPDSASITFRSLTIQSTNSAAHTVNFDRGATGGLNVRYGKLVLIGASPSNRLKIANVSTYAGSFVSVSPGSESVYGQNVHVDRFDCYGDSDYGTRSTVGYLGTGSIESNTGRGPGLAGWKFQDPPKISTLVDPLTTAPGSNPNWTVSGTVTQITTGKDGGGYRFAPGSSMTSADTYDLTSSAITIQHLGSNSTSAPTITYNIGIGDNAGGVFLELLRGDGVWVKPDISSGFIELWDVYNKFEIVSGNVLKFSCSSDGISWDSEILGTLPNPELFKSLRVSFNSEVSGTGSYMDIGSINPAIGPPDFDIIHTLTFDASEVGAGKTCPIRLRRGSQTIVADVYYRAGESGDWTSLSVASDGTTTFPVSSTTMQIGHTWNKSGNDYTTPMFNNNSSVGGKMKAIAIWQKEPLSGVVGNRFMTDYASNCSSLTKLEVPDTSGVTNIGYVFMNNYAYGCSSLTTLGAPDTSSITDADSLFMNNYAYGCSSLKTLDIPDTSSVISVGNSFMSGYAAICSSLKTLSVPDTSSITSIGGDFMSNYAGFCWSLTTLNLPKAGWFKTHNVYWNVPAGRLGVLKGNTTTETDQADWQALTTSGNTLYSNYIRSASDVWLNGVAPGTGNFLPFFLGGN